MGTPFADLGDARTAALGTADSRLGIRGRLGMAHITGDSRQSLETQSFSTDKGSYTSSESLSQAVPSVSLPEGSPVLAQDQPAGSAISTEG